MGVGKPSKAVGPVNPHQIFSPQTSSSPTSVAAGGMMIPPPETAPGLELAPHTPNANLSSIRSLEDLTILAFIAKGGFGEVWKASLVHRDPNSGRTVRSLVAVKMQRVNLGTRKTQRRLRLMHTERKLASSLGYHPFVATLLHCMDDACTQYMVMEYAPGGTLSDILDEAVKRTADPVDDPAAAAVAVLSEDTTHFVSMELVLALEHMHERRISFRDLKPCNVLICGRGHVKLADFGMAARLSGGAKHRTWLGTPDYMAPELIARKPYGHGVDMFALGCTIYELAHGYPPFADPEGNMGELLQRVVDGRRHPLMLCCSDPYSRLVERLLSPNPKFRLTARQARTEPFFRRDDWDAVLAGTIPSPLAQPPPSTMTPGAPKAASATSSRFPLASSFTSFSFTFRRRQTRKVVSTLNPRNTNNINTTADSTTRNNTNTAMLTPGAERRERRSTPLVVEHPQQQGAPLSTSPPPTTNSDNKQYAAMSNSGGGRTPMIPMWSPLTGKPTSYSTWEAPPSTLNTFHSANGTPLEEDGEDMPTPRRSRATIFGSMKSFGSSTKGALTVARKTLAGPTATTTTMSTSPPEPPPGVTSPPNGEAKASTSTLAPSDFEASGRRALCTLFDLVSSTKNVKNTTRALRGLITPHHFTFTLPGELATHPMAPALSPNTLVETFHGLEGIATFLEQSKHPVAEGLKAEDAWITKELKFEVSEDTTVASLERGAVAVRGFVSFRHFPATTNMAVWASFDPKELKLRSVEIFFDPIGLFLQMFESVAALAPYLKKSKGGVAAPRAPRAADEVHILDIDVLRGSGEGEWAMARRSNDNDTGVDGDAAESRENPHGLADYSILDVDVSCSYRQVVRYNARDELGAHSSLKSTKPSPRYTRAHYEREVLLHGAVSHPFVAALVDHFETDTHFFLVRRREMNSRPLQDVLRRASCTRLPLHAIKVFGAEMLCIVSHLHSIGIVLHDLSPRKFHIAADGHLKLMSMVFAEPLDFALGRSTGNHDPQQPLRFPWYLGRDIHSTTNAATTTGDEAVAGQQEEGPPSLEGVPPKLLRHVPPELFQGEPLGPDGDLWALGCALFELAVGRVPFDGETFDELREGVLSAEDDFSSLESAVHAAQEPRENNDEADFESNGGATTGSAGILLNEFTMLLSELLCRRQQRANVEKAKELPFFIDMDFAAVLQKRVPPPCFTGKKVSAGTNRPIPPDRGVVLEGEAATTASTAGAVSPPSLTSLTPIPPQRTELRQPQRRQDISSTAARPFSTNAIPQLLARACDLRARAVTDRAAWEEIAEDHIIVVLPRIHSLESKSVSSKTGAMHILGISDLLGDMARLRRVAEYNAASEKQQQRGEKATDNPFDDAEWKISDIMVSEDGKRGCAVAVSTVTVNGDGTEPATIELFRSTFYIVVSKRGKISLLESCIDHRGTLVRMRPFLQGE